jgi:hypothetical protein
MAVLPQVQHPVKSDTYMDGDVQEHAHGAPGGMGGMDM